MAIGRGVEPLKRDADSAYVHTRAREESGFGLLELLMAMVMLNVGILAIVAAFSSGNAALARASRVSTATALADSQLESYRGLIYDNIVFTTTEWNAAIADSTYTSDTTYVSNMQSGRSPMPESADVRVAMDQCKSGKATAGIPVLEQKLRNAKVDLPPRG